MRTNENDQNARVVYGRELAIKHPPPQVAHLITCRLLHSLRGVYLVSFAHIVSWVSHASSL